MVHQIVVTSLDWVVSWEVAVESTFLNRLKSILLALNDRGVVVVGFTGCDREEIEPIRAELSWHAPFIIESGSAILTPVSQPPFSTPLGELDGNYFVETLGCPYVQARAGLRVLANLISHPLKGFGDFTVPKLERFLAISAEAAHRAKAREFSEPFMTPKAVDADVLVNAAADMGFSVVLRDPQKTRFSELIGAKASVSSAVAKVVNAYQLDNESASVVVIGTAEDLQQVLPDEDGAAVWPVIEVRSPEQWLAELESCGTKIL
ncbi:MAG: hypothetical protein AAF703_12280 [Cyanobacteria bacterium P01_D01_bin.105]